MSENTTSHQTTAKQRSSKRRRAAVAAATLTATAGLGLAAAVPASAAGPSYLPSYGYSADFPTWWWGSTTLCVRNAGGNYGLAKVQSRSPFAGPEYISTPAYSTRCISRSWYAVPVTVTNVSYTPLYVTSY
jgi:hypothetical protein